MSDTQTTTPETTQAPAPVVSSRGMSFTTLDDGRIRADFPKLEPIYITPGELPEELMPLAVDAGLKDRLRGYTNKLSGDARTPEALRALVAIGVENLQKGIWALERGQGPSGEVSMEAEAAYLFRKNRHDALVAKGEASGEYPGTLEDDAAQFNALDDEKKKRLKGNLAFQKALEQVKMDRAQKRAAKLAEKAPAPTEGVDF